MSSVFALPSATVKIDRPANAEDENAPAPLPAELTTSTAMHLWFGLMQQALADGGDLTAFDVIGYTFLHYACLEGKYDVVEMLVKEKGVFVNAISENHQKIMPIHWAALRGHAKIIRFLLEHGGILDEGDSEGHTPLMKAAQYGQIPVIRLLLLRGADVHKMDIHGHQALHWAAYMGQEVTVSCLLKKGAQLHVKDHEQRTALHRAVQALNGNIIMLLLQAGAEVECGAEFGDNDMMKLATGRQGGKDIFGLQLILKSVQKKPNWFIRVMFSLPSNARGDYHFHSQKLTRRGRYPAMYAIFLGNAVNCFIVYFRFYAAYYSILTHFHILGMIAGVVSVSSYLTCVFMDPGFISCDSTEQEEREIEDLVSNGSATVCTTCNIRKPLRSKHCRFCDKCVAKFDHHCPWIGNCVGYRNQPFFVSFVSASSFAGVIFTLFGLYRITLDPACPPVSIYAFLSIFAYFGFAVWNYPHLVVTLGVTGIMTMYFFLMTLFHLKQVFSNITTNEMENAWRYTYLQEEVTDGTEGTTEMEDGARVTVHAQKKFSNPFDRGCTLNLVDSCFRPAWMAVSGRGPIWAEDGMIRACPSSTFPDYFRVLDVNQVRAARIPTYRELMEIRTSQGVAATNKKYERLSQDDVVEEAADNV